MNDLDHDLETELRQLAPAATSGKLLTSIDHDLRPVAPSASAHRLRVSLWASWTLTATAAAVAAVAWWPTAAPITNPAPVMNATDSSVVPVGSTNVLYGARDEGIVVLEDGRAAHKVRLHYVDTVRLEDRDARSSIAVSRPREEVRFVPVNFY